MFLDCFFQQANSFIHSFLGQGESQLAREIVRLLGDGVDISGSKKDLLSSQDGQRIKTAGWLVFVPGRPYLWLLHGGMVPRLPANIAH